MRRAGEIRVGIDGRAFMGRLTGVGRYVTELCKHLERVLPNGRFYVYSACPIELPVTSENWILRLDRSKLHQHFVNRGLWLILRAGELCCQDELDVFWGAVTLLPRLDPRVRAITTVYDLNHKVVPHTMQLRDLWARRTLFGRALARADAIISISRGTAARLRATYGFGTTAFVPPGVSAEFRARPPEEVAFCLTKYAVKSRYLLAVGTKEPRKNLELLVKVFVQMKSEGLIPEHWLVLAGDRGWRDNGLRRLVNDSALVGVISLNYVDQKDMPALYTGADALIFPSLYEGFGMPLLEARACGTCVVATDSPELREAGGPGAIYIQPNERGIRDGISAVTSQNIMKETEIEGLRTWQEGAQTLAEILSRGVVNKCRGTDSTIAAGKKDHRHGGDVPLLQRSLW